MNPNNVTIINKLVGNTQNVCLNTFIYLIINYVYLLHKLQDDMLLIQFKK